MKLCKFCKKKLVKKNGGKNWEAKQYCDRTCKDKWRIIDPESKRKGKEYRLANEQKIKKRQSIWYSNNKKKVLKKQSIYQKNNREKINIYLKQYMRDKRKDEDFRFKDNIRRKTNYYFNKKTKCDVCGSAKNLEFHHLKYCWPLSNKDLMTLCRTCHRKKENGFNNA